MMVKLAHGGFPGVAQSVIDEHEDSTQPYGAPVQLSKPRSVIMCCRCGAGPFHVAGIQEHHTEAHPRFAPVERFEEPWMPL